MAMQLTRMRLRGASVGLEGMRRKFPTLSRRMKLSRRKYSNQGLFGHKQSRALEGMSKFRAPRVMTARESPSHRGKAWSRGSVLESTSMKTSAETEMLITEEQMQQPWDGGLAKKYHWQVCNHLCTESFSQENFWTFYFAIWVATFHSSKTHGVQKSMMIKSPFQPECLLLPRLKWRISWLVTHLVEEFHISFGNAAPNVLVEFITDGIVE